MNVLWISPGFAADENDSTCIPSLQLLALALKTKEINLDILTIGFPFTSTAYTWNTISVKSGYGANGKWLRWLNWIRVYQLSLIHIFGVDCPKDLMTPIVESDS